jgi:hypothetical protein
MFVKFIRVLLVAIPLVGAGYVTFVLWAPLPGESELESWEPPQESGLFGYASSKVVVEFRVRTTPIPGREHWPCGSSCVEGIREVHVHYRPAALTVTIATTALVWGIVGLIIWRIGKKVRSSFGFQMQSNAEAS